MNNITSLAPVIESAVADINVGEECWLERFNTILSRMEPVNSHGRRFALYTLTYRLLMEIYQKKQCYAWTDNDIETYEGKVVGLVMESLERTATAPYVRTNEERLSQNIRMISYMVRTLINWLLTKFARVFK